MANKRLKAAKEKHKKFLAKYGLSDKPKKLSELRGVPLPEKIEYTSKYPSINEFNRGKS